MGIGSWRTLGRFMDVSRVGAITWRAGRCCFGLFLAHVGKRERLILWCVFVAMGENGRPLVA
jgi:hypothetical protein